MINKILKNDDNHIIIQLVFFVLFYLLSMIILMDISIFLIIFLLFSVFLYYIVDKKQYRKLMQYNIIPMWYLNYRKKQIERNIEKYNLKYVDAFHRNFITDRTDVIRYKKRAYVFKLISNPFDNCQSVSISNFINLLALGTTEKNEHENYINSFFDNVKCLYNKRMYIVDINEYALFKFKVFKKRFNLTDVKKMNYTSTNGSAMVIIKFVKE